MSWISVTCALVLAAAGEARADLALAPPKVETIAGHTLQVRPDGTADLDGKRLEIVPHTWKARTARVATEVTGDALTLLVEFELAGTRHDKPVWDLGGAIAAKIDLAKRAVVWRGRLDVRRDRAWSLIATPTHLYARGRQGIYALDRATGAEAWRIEKHYLRSTLVPPIFDAIQLTGNTIDVDAHWYENETRVPLHFELDAATGQRVYRKQKYVAPAPVAVYDQQEPYVIEYRGDRASPPVPTEWRALRVDYAYLVWSTKTGEGIVIDPTANDARAIVDIAQKQRANGKPVRWLAVYATEAAALHSTVPAVMFRPSYHSACCLGDLIRLGHETDLRDTGESIDASTVAAALGARVVDKELDKPLVATAGKVEATTDENDRGNLYLTWGPYVFFDRIQPPFTREKL